MFGKGFRGLASLFIVALALIAFGSGVVSAQVDEPPSFIFQGFLFEGDVLFPEETLAALVADEVGKPKNFEDLSEMASVIEAFYAQHGYSLVVAYFPEQDVTDGRVRLAILVARYGEVGFENFSRLKDEVVLRALADVEDEVFIHMPTFDRAIALLNELPGVYAWSSFAAGQGPGETDVYISVENARLWDATVSVGTSAPNWQQNLYGSPMLRGHNLFGYGDESTWTFSTDGRTQWTAHGTLEAPVGARLDGDRAVASARISRLFLPEPLDATNGSIMVGAGLKRGWAGVRGGDVDVQGTLEYRHLFEGIDESPETSRFRVGQITAQWRAAETPLLDSFTLHSARVEAVLGSLTLGTPSQRAFDQITARTEGVFGILRAEAQWRTRLDRSTVTVTWSGQLASKNLDSSEKFSLRGHGGVRSLKTGRTSGDDGWLVQVEIAPPPIESTRLAGRIQTTFFVDGGGVSYNKEPWDRSGEGGRVVYGAGIGVNWTIAPTLLLRIAHGWMLADSAGDSRAGDPGPLTVALSYTF